MSESIPKLMTWMTFLIIGSMALSLIICFAIIFAATGLHVLVASIILRGSMVTSWILGFMMIGLGSVLAKSKDRTAIKNISVALLIIGVVFVFATIVAGIDMTKLFTSPVRLLGKLGNVFTRLISKSGLGPKAVQGMEGESLMNTIGRIGTSIVIVQLITHLPLPFNILLFFLYYKFVTGLIFCGIPTLLAIWAFSQVYACKKEINRRENEYRALDDSDSDSSIVSVHGTEVEALLLKNKKTKKALLKTAEPSLNTTATSHVIVDQPRPPSNNQVHTANHIYALSPSPPHTSHRHVDYRSSELYPHV